MKIFLPYEKISKISDSARALLSPQTCSVRAPARIIGLIASSFRAVLPTKLHDRSLGHLKLQTLKASNNNFNATMSLTTAVCSDLLWRAQSGHLHNSISLRQAVHIVSLTTTDASKSDWGEVFEGQHTCGRRTPPEVSMHINYLELLAIFFAL